MSWGRRIVSSFPHFRGARFSDFFYKESKPKIYCFVLFFFFFWGGGGGGGNGGEGVVWLW